MSFLKLDFSRLSPSPSRSKGRSALSSTALIRKTEEDLQLNLGKCKNITPFGHYKNHLSSGNCSDEWNNEQFTSTKHISPKNEKGALETLIYEVVEKYFKEIERKVFEEIQLKNENYFTQLSDFNNLKKELSTKYSVLSSKIEELSALPSTNKIDNANQNIKNNESNKEFQKCLSYRSEYIDNDIEENTENLNEIKFLEKNFNNLRVKDSSKKLETVASKKNSNYFENSFHDYDFLLQEINKIKLKIENLEKMSEKNELKINENLLNNPLQLRLGSSTQKNKKQESLEVCHQQTPSFDQTNEFKFSIQNTPNQKNIKNYQIDEKFEYNNDLNDSLDMCMTDPHSITKINSELMKKESTNNNNNDFSPALSENKHVETFQEKYLIEKIALINPLNDDYLKKQKSINNFKVIKEEDIHLRISFPHKSIDDFDVNYEKDGFVPMFNFNSNKSQFTSHNSKKEPYFPLKSNVTSENDNDFVELGTNETKSANEIEEYNLNLNGKSQNFEEKDNFLKEKIERYEIEEADSNEESNDNDVIVYQLDEHNFLLDERGTYLFDNEQKQLKISVEDLEYLRKSFVVEKN